LIATTQVKKAIGLLYFIIHIAVGY